MARVRKIKEQYGALLRGDGSEIVKYTCEDLPIYVEFGKLSYFPNYSEIAHWHNDLEILIILDGEMDYCIDGEIVTIRKNQAIFVNSKHIHYGFSKEKKESEMVCMLIDAENIYPQSRFYTESIQPLLRGITQPYGILNMEGEEGDIIMTILRLHQNADREDFSVMALSAALNVLHCLYDVFSKNQNGDKAERSLGVIKQMLRFIQDNYADNISLADIAAAGNICKSSCVSVFNQVLRQSPVDFLIEYRLNKARKMLSDTEYSISDIALSVGFSSMSYFTDRFKRMYGQTPRDYRKTL